MFRAGTCSLLFAAALAGFWGCGTSAIGSDECRSVEYARCAAARYCAVGIDSNATEALCERFSRDNCLHGLASGKTPLPSDLNRCVSAINAAGTCARRQGKKTLASDCSDLAGAVATDRTTVCDVIQAPDSSSECAFLTETPVTVEDAGTSPEDAGSD